MGQTLKYAFKYSVPVMIGYIVLGFSFGILMIGLNFAWWVPVLMSVIIYAGAMQFAAADLLTASFQPLSAAILTLLVNARMLFYGISMLDSYQTSMPKKLLLAFGMTDETFAVNVGLDIPKTVDPIQLYLSVTLLNHSYWIIGTLLGVIVGQVLPIDYTGIEFALTALFIINFFEQMLKTKDYFSGAVGLLTTFASLMIFGADSFMIPAMIGIIAIFSWSFQRKVKEGN